jgi:hypothetical protein
MNHDPDNYDDIQQVQGITNQFSDFFGKMLLNSDITDEQRIALRQKMNRIHNGETTVADDVELALHRERRDRNLRIFTGEFLELLNTTTLLEGADFPETNHWETDGDKGVWEFYSLYKLTQEEVKAFAEKAGITDQIKSVDLAPFGEGTDHFWGFSIRFSEKVNGKSWRSISSTLNSKPLPADFYELANS